MTHKYITVSYDLYADNEQGIHELIEQAPEQYPFQFITNLGMALESFEAKFADLNEGDEFDFTIPMDEAYGPYDPERVIEVSKDMFVIDGRFADDAIYPGNVIPLVNEEGMRFYGLVSDVKDATVVLDLNEIHAGKDLHYKGKVMTCREATNAELQEAFNALAGGGGCGGCGGGCHDGGCGGGCHDGGCDGGCHDGGCHDGGCGHCH